LKYIENLLRTMAHEALVSATGVEAKADDFVPEPNEDSADIPFVNKLVDFSWRISLRNLTAGLFKPTTFVFLAQHLPLLSGEQKVLRMITCQGNIRASISADICFCESQKSGSSAQMINWFITRHCPVLVAVLKLPFFEEQEATRLSRDGGNLFQYLDKATIEFNTILQRHGAVGIPSALAVRSCTYFPLAISFGKRGPFLLAGSTVWLQSANSAGLATALLALLVRYCPLSRMAAQAIVDETDFNSMNSSQHDFHTAAERDVRVSSFLFPLTDTLDGNFCPVIVGQPIHPPARAELGEDDVQGIGIDVASDQVGPKPQRSMVQISPGSGMTPTDHRAIIELRVRLESVAVKTQIRTALQAQCVIPEHPQVPAPQLMNPIIEQRTGRFAEIYMALWLEQLLGDDFVPLQNWVSPNRVSLFADLGKTNLDDAAGFDFVFLDTRRLLDAPLAPGEIVVPRRVHLEVKGCYGSYSGAFFMSANEIATRAAIVQEAEEAGKRIEKQGFLPGTFEPVMLLLW